MGREILAAINQLSIETQTAILPLLAESYEARQERVETEKGHSGAGYRLMCIGNSVLFSLARIAFDEQDYGLTEQASVKRNDFFWAARAAKMLGRMDDARGYFKRYVEQIAGHNGHIPGPRFFLESKEYFSGGELEHLLLPLAERFGGDVPLLIRTFIAQEKGDKDFCRRVYRNSQRRLTRWQNKELPDYEDDSDAVVEHDLWGRELESQHAELCEVLGKFDKALEFIIHYGLNAHLVLYEPFSALVETREDKRRIYERVRIETLGTSSPNFLHMAMAAEKLGEEEKAEDYYHEALFREERDFDFAEALKIAKRLHLQERAIAYREIPAYLYEHGHI